MSNISTLPVQNGTTLLTPATLTYVERYQSFARRTAESIIGLALTLIEAEENLNSGDFEAFCNAIAVPKGGSTYKKLRTIGNNATRFEPFVENLPNTWTTIYKLAKLEPDEFDRVTAILSPFVSAKAIDEAIGSKSQRSPQSLSNVDVKISLDDLVSVEKEKVFSVLLDLKERYGFTLDISEDFEKQILQFHRQALAA